jgi:hypothetical protein
MLYNDMVMKKVDKSIYNSYNAIRSYTNESI